MDIVRFIGRILLIAFIVGVVASCISVGTPYVLQPSSMMESTNALSSADTAPYEALRIGLKFALIALGMSVLLTIIFATLELIMIAWRGRGIRVKYLRKVQTEAIKNELAYDELFDLCEDAVVNGDGRIIRADKSRGVIEAETKSKLTGLIEKLTIAVKKDGRVLLSSKTTSRFASFYNTATLGRNVQNLRVIIAYMEKHSSNLQARSLRLQPAKRNTLLAMGSVVLVTVMVVGACGLVLAASSELQKSRTSDAPTALPSEEKTTKESIRQGIKNLKEQNSLPIELAEGVAMTDVTEEKNAIRYHVLISDKLSYDLSPESMKSLTVSNACQAALGKDMLDEVNIEYLYTIKETSQSQLVVVTNDDCSKGEV